MEGTSSGDKEAGSSSRLYKWLSAPLLITVVGALLAGYLIPRITSETEDHRRAREIQSSLVQDMSQSVARVIATGGLIATGTVKKAGENTTAVFNDGLLEWRTNQASIEARLRSYFADATVGGRSLPVAWDLYSTRVGQLYYLSTTELKSRCTLTLDLKGYLSPGDPTPDCKGTDESQEEKLCADADGFTWRALAFCDEDSLKKSGKGYRRGPHYSKAYERVSRELLARERELLDAVRTTTPAGF